MVKRENDFPPKHQPLLAKIKHAMRTASLKGVFVWESGKGKPNSSQHCQEQSRQVLQGSAPQLCLMHLRNDSKSTGVHYSCSF